MQRRLPSTALGDLTVDLSGVDLADLSSPITTRIDHGLGDVDVLVPRSADVRLTVEQRHRRHRRVRPDSADGGYFPGIGSRPVVRRRRPEFRITVHSGVGDVEVSRG